MAVIDMAQLARYHSIFPELTEVQADTCLMVGMGMHIKTIADVRGVSQDAVKQSVTMAREKMGLSSLADVRLAVNVRVLLLMMEKLS
ncbi:helix-turn-helix transcriptional regulator [Dickeya undicola]|jgi:DNA-binding CsgD family transcriptional regulator|uniref:helix-turn-helix transcriptional regulator n=1 Tax=Dickeya undicola TaxID=1577887 RepID=UPI00126A56DB|nr:hypothetical protein [Dickeya undicola]